jgi:hypothetical protein
MRKLFIALTMASGLIAVSSAGASAAPLSAGLTGVSTNHSSVVKARLDDHHYSHRDYHRSSVRRDSHRR